MRVNREELLQQCESVTPGLSSKALLEQSDCFVFQNDYVMTFNGEIACRAKCPVGFEGAILAEKLMSLLSLRDDDDIEINAQDGEVVIKGKPWEAAITMQADISLPIDAVDTPEGWTKLHESFGDAIKMVHQCAGKDQSQVNLTCLHIHKKWIEATDTFQAGRYRLKTGFQEPTLIRQSSIKHIIDLGMTKFSETPAWVHFKNKNGLIISCLRLVDSFPEIDFMFEMEGKPTAFPKGIAKAVASAELFTKDNENDEITIDLLPGKIRIKGRSDNGRHREPKKARYDGKAISFTIPPKLLVEIVQQHQECLIGKERLKVDGGPFQYVTTLGKVEEE